jgi:hypothetical protein
LRRVLAIAAALALWLVFPVGTEVLWAQAESPGIVLTFYSNEGDAYLAEEREDGVFLKSKYPKTWFHGEPSQDHTIVEGQATIFLDASCAAVHSELGKGTWGWWNDVFHADFGSHTIFFLNQELFAHGHFAACEDHG